MRRAYTLLADAVGLVAGWAWLGNAGVGLIALWIWAAEHDLWRDRARVLRIALGKVRAVRLGHHRVARVAGWGQVVEVFADELPPEHYAWLRRELKWHFAQRRLVGRRL